MPSFKQETSKCINRMRNIYPKLMHFMESAWTPVQLLTHTILSFTFLLISVIEFDSNMSVANQRYLKIFYHSFTTGSRNVINNSTVVWTIQKVLNRNIWSSRNSLSRHFYPIWILDTSLVQTNICSLMRLMRRIATNIYNTIEAI